MTPREYHARREAKQLQQREKLRLDRLRQTRAAIRQLAPACAPIQAVYLYGSIVQHGRFYKHSDIDIAVAYAQTGNWLEQESAFWRALEETLQWPVDLRPYTPPITQAVANYGECVYARENDHTGTEYSKRSDRD